MPRLLMSFYRVRLDASGVTALASLAIASVSLMAMAAGAQSDTRCAVSSLLTLGLLSTIGWGRWRKITYDREIAAAYEGLAVSESAFRSLAESTGDIIVRLSVPSFVHVYVSPACHGILGLISDDLLGRPLGEIVHPDDRAALEQMAGSLAEETAEALPPSIAYRLRHNAGHWLWVEATVRATRGKGGVIDGLIWSIREIDGRRRIEAARAASEARFRLLAENASELIVLGFDDGRRSYISPASERMLGFTPTELEVEMASKRWVHPDDIDYLAKAEFATDNSHTVLQCRVRRKDQAWIWVEAIFRRMSQGGGDEPTVIATFRDVTERQASARILNDAKEAAEAARRAAEQASRAKSDFLATMSHEIRTPLNAILGFVGILEGERNLSPQGRHHLSRVKDAGQALRTIVDDILDFSTLEAGKIKLKPTVFCLASLAEGSAAMVQGLAKRKQLDLVVDFDPNAPGYLQGDEDRLRQILVNLLNNAVKFTRQGGIILRLRTIGHDEAAVRLRFEIVDTGIGIPLNKRESIFQRFSQVDGSISREFGGTGLGLAICRNLVEAMGGTIGFLSEVEVGSTFWIDVSLPIAAPPHAAMQTTGVPDTAAPPARFRVFDDLIATINHEPDVPVNRDKAESSRPLEILLVEDIKLNQELMCALLLERGHQVDVVGNGSEAIMAVVDKTYDLVLMDLQMPYVDGVSATTTIRALPTPDRFVPIVALTASVLGEQTDAALAAGMDGVLTKPVSPARLDAMIMKAALGDLGSATSSPLVDEEVAAKLEKAIGPVRFYSLRKQLRTSLIARFSVALCEATVTALKAEAHATIPGAAMLGFVRFAALCRTFIASEDIDTASEAHVAMGDEQRLVIQYLAAADRIAALNRTQAA